MWMPSLQHCVKHRPANRDYVPVTVQNGKIKARPCVSRRRGCGDPIRRPPFFRRHVELYVDWSILIVRKVGQDQRAWDYFRNYLNAGDRAHQDASS